MTVKSVWISIIWWLPLSIQEVLTYIRGYVRQAAPSCAVRWHGLSTKRGKHFLDFARCNIIENICILPDNGHLSHWEFLLQQLEPTLKKLLHYSPQKEFLTKMTCSSCDVNTPGTSSKEFQELWSSSCIMKAPKVVQESEGQSEK